MKTTIIKSKFRRMFLGGWRQKANTLQCPQSPSLEGKIVVITGGTSGIGLETVKGLIERDAEVIILARSEKKAIDLMTSTEGNIRFVKLDLSDLGTIPSAVTELQKILDHRKIDILINNAGIVSSGGYQQSSQGYELTFAVNVLGHHALFRQLDYKNLLVQNAHIISITGDIYIQAKDCTPESIIEGTGGMQAYPSSKVGLMWWAYQTVRKFPDYRMNLVHPGIVPSGLGNRESSLLVKILGKIMIDAEFGAQTTLYVATQDDIEDTAYYHNTLGRVVLPEDDIARDSSYAGIFWNRLDEIYGIHFGENK